VIINEKAALSLGFATPQAALGQKIKWGTEREILGIVKDYHHQGLKQTIDPIIFMPRHNGSYYAIRLSTDKVQSKMSELERLYKQNFPGNPFEYFFADENYNKQYKAEMQYGTIFTIASFLAIFIGCLGLFGLASFSVEQKTKEIGIRKVLGASVSQIVTLLSKDFLKLVLIAFVIAVPVAWYAMHQWLQDFAYRIDISWWIFALAGVLALLIALLTVSFQAIRAALANPVKSLRTE
ncbi:MAG: FtsX-like permease family protein, partial [Verrucomicrobia bacterium]|nr:FtsX-like permease family protein [Cytophagales bacterium]